MTSHESFGQLHELEGELHAVRIQHQSLRAQLAEIENAQRELRGTERAYRIVGAVMVQAQPEKLTQELSVRKEDVAEKIAGLARHEERLRARFEELQHNALKGG